jgi:hypothetical protein
MNECSYWVPFCLIFNVLCAVFSFSFFKIVFVVHVLLRVFRTRTVWSQLEVFSSLSLSLSRPLHEDLVLSCAASRH